MRYCPNCGAQNEDANKFCTSCGSEIPAAHQENHDRPNTYDQHETYDRRGSFDQPKDRVVYTNARPRSIILAIVLSVVTCGIYSLFWVVSINNDLNEMTEDQGGMGGAAVILLSLVTCGIYYLYWLYKMGNKCDDIGQVNGSKGILCLLLGIFGLSIISLAIMQDSINKAVDHS